MYCFHVLFDYLFLLFLFIHTGARDLFEFMKHFYNYFTIIYLNTSLAHSHMNYLSETRLQ